MSIFEYNDERQAKLFRQEGYEDGLEEGLKKGLKMMTALISRTMKAKGISFKEACAALLLNDEEIAECKEYMHRFQTEEEK
jgi:flagellar biosynthesis/type III secretory pathway protein FliH